MHPRYTSDRVTIERYRPEYREYFKALNIEWLERYFRVEPHDVTVLSDPENEIVHHAGEIFFALHDSEVIGTCALVRVNATTYELAKMAVTPAAQGLGVGLKLAHAVIDGARSRGATSIVLESNTKLVPAITMYRKLGFVEMPHPEPSAYERSNIYMQLDLRQDS